VFTIVILCKFNLFVRQKKLTAMNCLDCLLINPIQVQRRNERLCLTGADQAGYAWIRRDICVRNRRATTASHIHSDAAAPRAGQSSHTLLPYHTRTTSRRRRSRSRSTTGSAQRRQVAVPGFPFASSVASLPSLPR